MPAITKKDSRLQLQFLPNSDHSIHAGLLAVEALARRFDLWNKLRQLPGLDPRKDKRRGYEPEVIVGQLLYALCSGGGCLSDSEALNDDPLARELFGVEKFADQSQVGEWLREQSEESVTALRGLLHELVAWVWQQADPCRLLHAGQCEVFFDDTQPEVTGQCFEGADFNYNKQLALSWQTLWVGPLLADSHLGRGRLFFCLGLPPVQGGPNFARASGQLFPSLGLPPVQGGPNYLQGKEQSPQCLGLPPVQGGPNWWPPEG